MQKKVGWGEGWTHGSQPREEKLGAVGRASLHRESRGGDLLVKEKFRYPGI